VHPALAGSDEEVAARLVAAYGDSLAGPPQDLQPGLRWNTSLGHLKMTPQGEGEVGRDWVYTNLLEWPDHDEAVARSRLQGILDNVTAGTPWPLHVDEPHSRVLLLEQTFEGSDYGFWAGALHLGTNETYEEQDMPEHPHPSVLEIYGPRGMSGTPMPVDHLIGAAAAFVACDLGAGADSWLPQIHADAAHVRGLLDPGGRPVLYVGWVWTSGGPPAGCNEYALYGIQVDAMTGLVTDAQRPAQLARCAPPVATFGRGLSEQP
jgi:hypothetical protein